MTTYAFADNGSPVTRASVFWVGHSLVEQKIETPSGKTNLMQLVGMLADRQGLAYTHGDHTLWGSSISALWRGRPHRYERDAGIMVAKRENFERDPGRYDTIVLTEALPVKGNLEGEYSAYYLRRFACTLISARPDARVLLYQTWTNLQPGKKWRDYDDWRRDMKVERSAWSRLASTGAKPDVPAPHWLARFGLGSKSNGGCSATLKIEMVPVGNVFVELSHLSDQPESADLPLRSNGQKLTLADMFANPIYAKNSSGAATLRDPERDHDDIHLSAEGVYVAALTHYAVLYRRSPIGLPAWPSLGPAISKVLQEIVDRTVTEK